jgi:hypothetical protein
VGSAGLAAEQQLTLAELLEFNHSGLEFPEGFRCGGCGRASGEVQKLTSIATAPPLLLLTFKRFFVRNQRTVRDNRRVRLPLTLESRFLPAGGRYQLRAAVCHEGDTATSGHYTTVGATSLLFAVRVDPVSSGPVRACPTACLALGWLLGVQREERATRGACSTICRARRLLLHRRSWRTLRTSGRTTSCCTSAWPPRRLRAHSVQVRVQEPGLALELAVAPADAVTGVAAELLERVTSANAACGGRAACMWMCSDEREDVGSQEGAAFEQTFPSSQLSQCIPPPAAA